MIADCAITAYLTAGSSEIIKAVQVAISLDTEEPEQCVASRTDIIYFMKRKLYFLHDVLSWTQSERIRKLKRSISSQNYYILLWIALPSMKQKIAGINHGRMRFLNSIPAINSTIGTANVCLRTFDFVSLFVIVNLSFKLRRLQFFVNKTWYCVNRCVSWMSRNNHLVKKVWVLILNHCEASGEFWELYIHEHITKKINPETYF